MEGLMFLGLAGIALTVIVKAVAAIVMRGE
jgi:hypothetical protein